MAAPTPHLVIGTVRKGPYEAKSIVSSTVGSGANTTVDVYLGGSTRLATSQTVTLTHTSSEETLTTTTDSNGKYSIDLSGLTSWSAGDAFTITVSTISTAALSDTSLLSGVRPVMLVDSDRSGHSRDYPLPVQMVNDGLPFQNYSEVYTYTGSLITQIDRTINGVTYRQTLTYSGTKIVGRSAWVRV